MGWSVSNTFIYNLSSVPKVLDGNDDMTISTSKHHIQFQYFCFLKKKKKRVF